MCDEAALRSMGKVPQTMLSPKLKHKPRQNSFNCFSHFCSTPWCKL